MSGKTVFGSVSLETRNPKKLATETANRDPKTTDLNRKVGTPWVNKLTNKAFILTSITSGSANWEQYAGALSDLVVDNLKLDGNTISSTDTNGDINVTPDGTGSVVISDIDVAAGEIDGTAIGANSASTGAFTQVVVDNLTVDGNTISSTDTNGNINLDPDGTGNAVLASGDFSVTAGDVAIAGAGQQLSVKGGAATDFIGQATLSSGTVTVANTNIAATDRIFLSYEGGSISNSGQLSYTISAGTSFTIESTNGSDANDVSYFIVRQTA